MNRSALRAAIADVLAVVVFVALGRRSHDEGSALSGTLRVAGPFLIGLAVAWAVTRAWRTPLAVRTGASVWLVTVAVGLVLRRTVFDRGIAPAFVIVALIVLGAFLVGWRAAFGALRRRAGERPA